MYSKAFTLGTAELRLYLSCKSSLSSASGVTSPNDRTGISAKPAPMPSSSADSVSVLCRRVRWRIASPRKPGTTGGRLSRQRIAMCFDHLCRVIRPKPVSSTHIMATFEGVRTVSDEPKALDSRQRSRKGPRMSDARSSCLACVTNSYRATIWEGKRRM